MVENLAVLISIDDGNGKSKAVHYTWLLMCVVNAKKDVRRKRKRKRRRRRRSKCVERTNERML
jgi:DNA-directed RNA polymerase specialized sigma24 family protein